MREIKKLKHSEPHKFKRKAKEDQYKFNLKFEETAKKRHVRRANVPAAYVKPELDEGEKLLHMLLAH